VGVLDLCALAQGKRVLGGNGRGEEEGGKERGEVTRHRGMLWVRAMGFKELQARAAAMDADDPLAGFRDRLEVPDGVYLDGNSLGLLPRATPARMRDVVEREWGQGLIGSWNAADWIGAPARVGAMIAPLIGVAADEVIVCDTVSVNLFKLVAAALKLRPERRVVLLEAGDFPTDAYVADGAARLMGAEVRAVPREEVSSALGEEVALLLLSAVHYRTAAAWDIAVLTAAAQAAGALVLWDLSHAAGAMPVALGAADFAVGCGYKYLHGGPGAPAFAFVARRHQAALEQPIQGWMGHASPFAFEGGYRPAAGTARLLAGTPPILSMAALEEGVRLVADAGVPRIGAKAQALGDLFIACVEAIDDPDLAVASPRTGRGGHVLLAHPHAFELVQALNARGVVGDFRAPDGARFGFAPLGLRFADVVQAAEVLREVLKGRLWDAPEFRVRGAVT
jgi:kynureninase